jgi:hypothetical protein
VSTSKETVAYIEDQLDGLDIRTTRMFGEYAIYCDNKVVGGSKDYHSVPGDLLERREWLHTAVQATADALPVPAPKKTTAV